jgi:hypothetical protein
LKTELPLLKYTLPAVSTVTRLGWPMEVLEAGAGVVVGAPPATVEIEYGCAKAAQQATAHTAPPPHSLATGFGMYTSLSDRVTAKRPV